MGLSCRQSWIHLAVADSVLTGAGRDGHLFPVFVKVETSQGTGVTYVGTLPRDLVGQFETL